MIKIYSIKRARLTPQLWFGIVVASLVVAAFTRITHLRDADSDPQIDKDNISLGAWHERWGTSPLGNDGVPSWARSTDDDQWQASDPNGYAVAPSPQAHEIWQRTILPNEGNFGEASVYLPGVWKVFSVYLDGKPIYQYGKFLDDGTLYHPGRTLHIVPLGANWRGKILAIRSRSDDAYVGAFRPPLLGKDRQLAAHIVHKDTPLIILGVSYIAISLTMIAILLGMRRGEMYLQCALYLLFVGFYDISRADAKIALIDWPMFWDCVELISFMAIPNPILSFFENIFGKGPLGSFRVLRYLQIAFTTSALAYIAVFGQAPWLFLSSFQVLFMIAALTMVVASTGRAYRDRTVDMVIFSGGFIIAAVVSIYDVLGAMGYIPPHAFVSHVGVFAMVVSLAIITSRHALKASKAQMELEIAQVTQNALKTERDELKRLNTELSYAKEQIVQQTQLLVQSSKMSALGEMGSGMAHEVNNPLTILMGNAFVLKKSLEQDAAQAKYHDKIGLIISQAERIAAVVKALRHYTADQCQSYVGPMNVANIIEQTIMLCAGSLESSGIELRRDMNEKGIVHADSSRLSEAILALIFNARDAASSTSDKWIEITLRNVGNNVVISVRDSGRGIPEVIQQRMMNPFFTTKLVGQGKGLGLSSARAICEQLGGSLRYDSESGHTRFTIELPRVEAGDKQVA